MNSIVVLPCLLSPALAELQYMLEQNRKAETEIFVSSQ